jgi:23S rRNA pseudouridine2457 synthase
MLRYFITYKPFNMLCQFTPDKPGDITLKDLPGLPNDVYPVGRLDKDSEGLLLITNDKALTHNLLHPSNEHEREYWAQVEGVPAPEALAKLEKGIDLKDYFTRPAKGHILDPQPQMPERNPPIRFRKNIPDTWISLILTEGKNRQVRRMTAAIGYPTLRLVRVRIEGIRLGKMKPGDVQELKREEVYRSLRLKKV